MSCFETGFDRAPLPMRLVCSSNAAACCRPCLLLPLCRAAPGTLCAPPLTLSLSLSTLCSYKHGMLEKSGLPSKSQDLVAVQFVIHECPADIISQMVRCGCIQAASLSQPLRC